MNAGAGRGDLGEPERHDRFEDVYRSGTAPWDIGRPQPAFVELEEAGEIVGSVLDLGCGTGENALYLAEKGHEVVGIDGAPTAVRAARAKAKERGLAVDLRIWNALDLDALHREFDTVIDSGFFHTLDDHERVRLAAQLSLALRFGGHYFMLCFSEHARGDEGPRRVTRDEIRATFSSGWRVIDIRAHEMEGRHGAVPGWLAVVQRP